MTAALGMEQSDLKRAAELLRRYASVVRDCHSSELERFDYIPEIEECAATVERAAALASPPGAPDRLAARIIADYKEHYDFPPQGESHMRDCIMDALDASPTSPPAQPIVAEAPLGYAAPWKPEDEARLDAALERRFASEKERERLGELIARLDDYAAPGNEYHRKFMGHLTWMPLEYADWALLSKALRQADAPVGWKDAADARRYRYLRRAECHPSIYNKYGEAMDESIDEILAATPRPAGSAE